MGRHLSMCVRTVRTYVRTHVHLLLLPPLPPPLLLLLYARELWHGAQTQPVHTYPCTGG